MKHGAAAAGEEHIQMTYLEYRKPAWNSFGRV